MSDKNSYYIINTNDKPCVDLFVISILQLFEILLLILYKYLLMP